MRSGLHLMRLALRVALVLGILFMLASMFAPALLPTHLRPPATRGEPFRGWEHAPFTPTGPALA
jgi:hypothetical protein